MYISKFLKSHANVYEQRFVYAEKDKKAVEKDRNTTAANKLEKDHERATVDFASKYVEKRCSYRFACPLQRFGDVHKTYLRTFSRLQMRQNLLVLT